ASAHSWIALALASSIAFGDATGRFVAVAVAIVPSLSVGQRPRCSAMCRADNTVLGVSIHRSKPEAIPLAGAGCCTGMAVGTCAPAQAHWSVLSNAWHRPDADPPTSDSASAAAGQWPDRSAAPPHHWHGDSLP